MSEPSAPRIAPGIPTTRAVAVACVVALIGLGLLWELAWAPTGRGTLAIKVLPLAFAVPGLLRYRLYTYRWTSLLVWLYAAEGAMRLRDPAWPVPALAATELALSLVLFAACGLHVRRRLAAGRALEASAGAATGAPTGASS
jgi:uncharacterized membrane protein